MLNYIGDCIVFENYVETHFIRTLFSIFFVFFIQKPTTKLDENFYEPVKDSTLRNEKVFQSERGKVLMQQSFTTLSFELTKTFENLRPPKTLLRLFLTLASRSHLLSQLTSKFNFWGAVFLRFGFGELFNFHINSLTKLRGTK